MLILYTFWRKQKKITTFAYESMLVKFVIFVTCTAKDNPSFLGNKNKIRKAVEIGRFCHNMHKQERYYFIRHNWLYMISLMSVTGPGLKHYMQMKATAFFVWISPKHIIKFPKNVSRKKICLGWYAFPKVDKKRNILKSSFVYHNLVGENRGLFWWHKTVFLFGHCETMAFYLLMDSGYK